MSSTGVRAECDCGTAHGGSQSYPSNCVVLRVNEDDFKVLVGGILHGRYEFSTVSQPD